MFSRLSKYFQWMFHWGRWSAEWSFFIQELPAAQGSSFSEVWNKVEVPAYEGTSVLIYQPMRKYCIQCNTEASHQTLTKLNGLHGVFSPEQTHWKSSALPTLDSVHYYQNSLCQPVPIIVHDHYNHLPWVTVHLLPFVQCASGFRSLIQPPFSSYHLALPGLTSS